jgi:prepilin-type N-terminal cleavage/methylation domain-containing protein
MKNSKAFTLAETMITVAVVGILAAIAAFSVSNLVSSARNQKLFSDINTLNRSFTAYRGAGGDLSKATTPEEVLSALKKRMSNGSRVPTLSRSKIDERVTLEFQDASEASGTDWRAYWDASQYRFVLQKSGSSPGVKGLSLDPTAVPDDEVDGNSKSAMLYAKEDTWIWDFDEVPVPVPAGPSNFTVGEVPDSSTPPPVTPPSLPPSSTTALAPPGFSIPEGSFPISSFNLPLSLTNPNPAGTSTIYYSIDFGNWKVYSGPLSVSPGSVVAAQAIAVNDLLYTNSSRVDQSYAALPSLLLEPIITPDIPVFGLFSNRTIKVTITDLNDPSISKLQYRIGGDPWQDYDKTISVRFKSEVQRQ